MKLIGDCSEHPTLCSCSKSARQRGIFLLVTISTGFILIRRLYISPTSLSAMIETRLRLSLCHYVGGVPITAPVTGSMACRNFLSVCPSVRPRAECLPEAQPCASFLFSSPSHHTQAEKWTVKHLLIQIHQSVIYILFHLFYWCNDLMPHFFLFLLLVLLLIRLYNHKMLINHKNK